MTIDMHAARPVARFDRLHAEVHAWLDHEAAVLDRQDYSGWLALLDPELSYVAPTRATVLRGDPNDSAASYGHFVETYGSIDFRVKRLSDPSAWSENPASRTRRFVTNVLVYELEDGAVEVQSYLLLLRNRGDDPQFDLISCARRDKLRPHTDYRFRLSSRLIELDQATLGTPNLAIFL